MSQTDTTSTFLFTDIGRAGGDFFFLHNYIGDYLKDILIETSSILFNKSPLVEWRKPIVFKSRIHVIWMVQYGGRNM